MKSFATRKCVHIKLQTPIVADFKIELLKRSLTMQETFNEFAKLISIGDAQALRMLDRILIKRNKDRLSELMKSAKQTTKEEIKISSKRIPTQQDAALLDVLEKVNPLSEEEVT